MAKGQLRRWLYQREFMAATHVVTIGEWWAARAAARLKRIKGFFTKKEV